MNLYEKISVLGSGAKYDTCGPRDFGDTTDIPGVYHAKVSGGHMCRLFKVLQTNVCKNNCNYCAFRRDRGCSRVAASPNEMAQAFDSAYSRRLVDGLFLSSGIMGDPQHTMTQMLDTVHILRKQYQYKGYVHLKIMPGTSGDCIRESLKVANRISINIESPTEANLAELSPDKGLRYGFFDTLLNVRKEISCFKSQGIRPPSLTTQFVIGAATEKDKDVIRVTDFLYKKFGLTRVFYSAFRPVDDTPLAERPAESITRVHRLYQADFLMRFYRFLPQDLPLNEKGFLYEAVDPKLLWAQRHPEVFPVNINKAKYWDLLKVPGMGPISAKKVLEIRKRGCFSSLDQLAGSRLQVGKIAKYVCL